MPVETERKFLVNNLWSAPKYGKEIIQGYLCKDPDRSVRIRYSKFHPCFITIKGKTTNISREEYEYQIPEKDAWNMLDMIPANEWVIKTRYMQLVGGKHWEIDVFHNNNDGLIIAEVELKEENEKFERPEWLGEEITHDPKYYNLNLSLNPYCSWLK